MNLEEIVKKDLKNIKEMSLDELLNYSSKNNLNFTKLCLYKNSIEEKEKEKNIKQKERKEKYKNYKGKITTEFNCEYNSQINNAVNQILDKTYKFYISNSRHKALDNLTAFKNFVHNNLEKITSEKEIAKESKNKIIKYFKNKDKLFFEIDRFLYNKKIDMRFLSADLSNIFGIYSDKQFPEIKYSSEHEIVYLEKNNRKISMIDNNDYLLKDINQKRKYYDSMSEKYIENLKENSTINYLGKDEVNFGQYLHLKNILDKKHIKINAKIYEKDKRKFNVMKKIIESKPELFSNIELINENISEEIYIPTPSYIEPEERKTEEEKRYDNWKRLSGIKIKEENKIYFNTEDDKKPIRFGKEKLGIRAYQKIYSQIQQNINDNVNYEYEECNKISKDFYNGIKEIVEKKENKFNIVYNNGKTFFG